MGGAVGGARSEAQENTSSWVTASSAEALPVFTRLYDSHSAIQHVAQTAGRQWRRWAGCCGVEGGGAGRSGPALRFHPPLRRHSSMPFRKSVYILTPLDLSPHHQRAHPFHQQQAHPPHPPHRRQAHPHRHFWEELCPFLPLPPPAAPAVATAPESTRYRILRLARAQRFGETPAANTASDATSRSERPRPG